MEENKEKRIYLPKNVKHLNWNVWREISIFDLAFFIIFAFIGSIGILAGADWSIKATINDYLLTNCNYWSFTTWRRKNMRIIFKFP